MKKYEVVHEISRPCSGNQDGEVTVDDEVAIEDLDEYVRKQFKGSEVSFTKETMKDGSIVYYVTYAGYTQKFTFAEV